MITFETIETICIVGSIVASVMSVSALLIGRTQKRGPGPTVTVTVTIEDPVAGLVRTVARSTRRAEDIRRDVERAIRGG